MTTSRTVVTVAVVLAPAVGLLASAAAAQRIGDSKDGGAWSRPPEVNVALAALRPFRVTRLGENRPQPAPQAAEECCSPDEFWLYADDYYENSVVALFYPYFSDPGWITFSTNCGTVSPRGARASYHPSGFYWAYTEYVPCDRECTTATVVANPAVGDTWSLSLCLEERIDLCWEESAEICVCTYDPDTFEDAPADVSVALIPPADGAAEPASGRSHWDSQAGCYTFCTIYTAGDLRMNKIRVKMWQPPHADIRSIFSFDQLGCCGDEQCDDGVFCNGQETCLSGICLLGDDPCPGQVCCQDTQTCEECCDNEDCPDNDVFCDGDETCVSRVCVSEGNPCSGDTPVCCENSESCAAECCTDAECPDDGLYCDGLEVCAEGECTSTGSPCGPEAPVCCEENDTCALECCDHTQCPDNGLFCDGGEVCRDGVCTSEGNPCSGETPVCCESMQTCAAECCENADCDDGNDCTDDACDENGDCLNTMLSAETPCGDATGDDCTNPDRCDGEGNCLPNHAPNGTPCEDGLFCTDDDTCAEGTCQGGPSPCTDPNNQFCDEALDSCRPGCLANSECDDGNECTGDVCDENGDCLNPMLAAETPCGDATETDCDAPDTCDGDGNCLPNLAADGIPCSDGLFCTTGDVCWDGICLGGDSPCIFPTLPICDEENNLCKPGCVLDIECDDGNECTTDLCAVNGDCIHSPRTAGTPCGDDTDDDCTNPDTCDGDGTCVPNHAPDDTPCPDDRFCNGQDVCQDGRCVSPGTPCDPGFKCNETDDACYCDGDDDCDDGLWCNGAEVCVDKVCETPDPPCGDRLDCDELNNRCFCGSDAACNDGLFCNGSETCNEGICEDGTPPQCEIDSKWMVGFCDEQTDQCADELICQLVIVGPSEVGRGQRAAFTAMIEWDAGWPSGDVSSRAAWAVLSNPESGTPSSVATISADGVLTQTGLFGETTDVWVQARVEDAAGVELVQAKKVTLNAALDAGDSEPADAPIPQDGCGFCGTLDSISAAIMLAGLLVLHGVGHRKNLLPPKTS